MAVDRASHTRHDQFAIAESIGGGFAPATIGTCPSCGALHADLLTLQRAVRESWLPRRPRDLRLTVENALRLSRRTWRQRLGLIGSWADPITRPLAVGLTAIGLAGVLLTSMPTVAFLGSAGAASAEGTRQMLAGAPTASGAPEPIATDTHVAREPDDPLTVRGVSLLFLATGASIFLVRRIAPRTRAVR